MRAVRWILRVAAYAGLALLAVVVLVVAAALFVGGTETGREWLAATVTEQISVPGETQVAISRLEGPLPGTIVIQGLTVEDRDGVWLTLDQATLKWDPWRLLFGEFSVELLEAVGVTVVRPPIPGEQPAETPSEPFQWPTLPIEVSIEKFAAAPIKLGEAVLGVPATLEAEGEARIGESGKAVARLSVVRTDGPVSRIAVDATYDPQTDMLAVDARAEEPEGGLIARAAGFDPPPPVSLTFSGEGLVSDWVGRLEGSFGNQAEVEAEIAISRPDGQMALRIESLLRAPGLTPPAVEPLAGDGVRFVFEGRTTGPNTVSVDRLSIATSALEATVTADLNMESQSVEGSAEVIVKDGAALGVLTAPAEVTGARLNATFAGPILQPRIEVTTRASSVDLPQAILHDLSLDLVLEPGRPIDQGPIQAHFDVKGRIAGIESPSLPAGDLAAPFTFGAAGEVDLDAGSLALSSFEASTPTMTASASGEVDLNTLAARGTASLAADNLVALSPLVGKPLSGSADLSADFSVTENMRSVEADLNGELRGINAEGLPLADIFGDLTTIAGTISTDAQGTKSGQLEVKAKAGNLTASATVPPDGTPIEGTYRLLVPDLAAVAGAFGVPAGGNLTLSGNVAGEVADPTVTASLVVSSARVSGQALGTIRADARVETAVSAPTGKLDFSASPEAGKVGLTTSFALRDQVLHLDPLQLSVAGSRIDGAIAAPVDGAPVTGRLAGDLGKLGPLLALAGIEGTGSGSLAVRLSGKEGAQAVDAEVSLRDIALHAPEGGEPTTMAQADANAQLVLRATPGGTATLTASGIEAGTTQVASVSFEGSGDMKKMDVRLDARGQSFAPFTVSTEGSVSVAGGGGSLALSTLNATIDSERITLASPATLSWRPTGTEISNLDLRVAGGRITADAELGADRFSGTVDISQLPLSLARLFMPNQEIGGTLSGQASVSGTVRSPEASVSLRFSDVRASAAGDAPPVDGTLDAEWQGTEVTARLAVSGFSEQPLQSSITVPLRLDPQTMTPSVPTNGPVSGSIRWSGEVGPLFLLAPLPNQRLTGIANIALGIDGTVASPQLTGFVTLENGTYEHLVAGTLMRSLNLRVDAEGRRLVLSSLSATDGGSGRLSGSGAFSLEQAVPGVEFNIRARDFIAVRRDDVTASTDADLAFAKTPDGARLSGEIRVEQAEIRLVNNLPPSVVTLDVIERNGPEQLSPETAETEETLETPDAGSSAIELDLHVSMPERIFVRGRGLDSEWSGNFRITGTADAPQIRGELSSVRGQLSLLNEVFKLQPSTIRVTQGNSGEMILNLSIKATAEADDFTAIVEITGTAANPEIRLSSIPELPQDEVLARLLFGRPSGQLTAIEAIQLAAAVRELTGSGGPGILDMGRKLLGVDVLRVGGGGEGGTGATVEAGTYVSEDVFVGVEQGTAAGSGAASVEIEVFPNVSVTSKIGQSGDANVGVQVQWDY